MKIIRLFCLAIFLFMVQNSYSQRIYLQDQVSISGACLFYDHLHFSGRHGEALKSKYPMSFDLGATYRHYFSNGAGVGLTLGYTMPPVNTNLSMESPSPQGEQISLHSTKYKQNLLSVALSEQAAFSVGHAGNYYITTEAGLRAFFDLSKPWAIEEEVLVPIDDSTTMKAYEFSLQGRKSVLFGLFIKLGFLQAMNSGNTIQCAAVLNYNFRNVNEGHYFYDNRSSYGMGTLKQPVSFIGIELTYGFTLSSRAE